MKCPKCHSENPDTKQFCGDCGTQLNHIEEAQPSLTKTLETPKEDLKRGTILADRYEIIEELGKGGMGTVYRAHDQEIDEEVAIKLLKSEIARDEKTIERFRNELKIARSVSHKHVCRMYDIGREDEKYFITMEYVSGKGLKSLIREKEKIPESEVLRIAQQICEGLAGAHEMGIVHRDLKPQNIMMDKKGDAKIMDFGIARSVEAPGVTQTGVIIGTPDYISPEQAEGQEADHRSDIYSFGVILYEMVTGTVPFKGDTALSVAVKHKTQLPTDPRKLNPKMSDDLAQLILICMEKDRNRRYQTAAELLTDLKNIKGGFSLGTRMRPRQETFIGALIRKKLFIPALVMALATISVVVWQLLLQKEVIYPPKIENSIAIISFESQTGDKAYDHLRDMIPNLLITNLENTGKFYVLTWERMRDLLKKIGKRNVEFIDSDTGFELCKAEGVGAIVTGKYTKAGDVFALNVHVYEVDTKESLQSATSRGEGEASILRTQIDDLSRNIAQGIIGKMPSDIAAMNITDVTTDSIEAYNYFLKGREAFERSYLKEAVEFLEKALELDPDFISPYLYLVWLYSLRDDTKSLRNALEKAKALSDHAIEKEKLFIKAESANFIENNPEKYIKLLRQIVRQYAKEKIIYHFLGDHYFLRNEYHEAIEEYTKGLELDPEYGLLLYHVALAYLMLGDTEKAAEYLERYAFVGPEDAIIPYLWGGVYLISGRMDEALSKFKEALKMKADYPWPVPYIVYTHAMKEDYSEVFYWVDKFISDFSNPQQKANLYLWRAVFHFWLGNLSMSLDDLNNAENFGKSLGNIQRCGIEWIRFVIYYTKSEYDISRTHLENYRNLIQRDWPIEYAQYLLGLGLLDMKNGRIELAEIRLAEANSITPDTRHIPIYKCGLFQGELWLAKGVPDKVVSTRKKTMPTRFFHQGLPRVYVFGLPFYEDVTARACLLMGNLEKAIKEYENLVAHVQSTGRLWPIHPLYHYRLAKLYEQKSWEGKAIEHYEKFLDLWKDADSGIAEVEDAKKRLIGLKNQ